MRLKTLFAAAALALLQLSIPDPLRADAYDTYGAGSRGIALAGAVCASVDDLEAVYYNPAGLGKSKGNTIRANYFYAHPLQSVGGYAVGTPTTKDTSLGMVSADLGLSVNEIINRLPVQVTFAFSMSMLHDGTLAKIQDVDEWRYQYVRYGPAISRSVIYMGLGVEVYPKWVWIGGGAHAMIKGDAAANMTIPPEALSTVFPVVPASQDIYMNVKAEVNPICGIVVNPYKDLNLGFSYKNDIAARVNPFIANLVVPVGAFSALMRAYTAIMTYYNPDMFRFGVSYKVVGLNIEFNAVMEQWSGFRRSAPRAVRSTAPRFRNIITYQGGLEYEISIVKIRAGYQYAPSPVPKQPLYSNYLDTTRHIVAIGAAVSVKDPWNILRQPVIIEVALQDQILAPKSEAKPSLVMPGGISSYSLKGHNLVASAGVRFKFGSTIEAKTGDDDGKDADDLKIKDRKKKKVSEF